MKASRERSSRQKGFTLIELMIVIAIIGILAAIAIPQFAAFRTRAYLSALQSDAHTIANAQEAYYADLGTYASDPASVINNTYGAVAVSRNTTVGPPFEGDRTSFHFTLTDSAHGLSLAYNSQNGGMQ